MLDNEFDKWQKATSILMSKHDVYKKALEEIVAYKDTFFNKDYSDAMAAYEESLRRYKPVYDALVCAKLSAIAIEALAQAEELKKK